MVLDRIMRVVKGWWLIGLIVGGLSMAIAWAIGFFKIPTVTLTMSTIDVRSQLASGISPSAGNKILAYLQGIVPSTATGYLAVLISGVVLVILGRLAYELIPAGKIIGQDTPIAKLISVIVFGTVIGTIILAGFLAFPAIPALIALLIYAAFLSVGLVLLDRFGALKIVGGIPA